MIRDFDFHPGEPHVRLFSFDRSSVLRWDERAVVLEARYGDVILRHYAFADEWFKINVTIDHAGHIIETPATAVAPAFAFNCDIATPMIRDGVAIHAAMYAVDLCADVLVCKDGMTFEIVDQTDLDAARSHGLIFDHEHRHGKRGLDRLLELLRGNKLIPFLNDEYPFGPTTAPPSGQMTRVPLSDVPLLQPGRRSTWRSASWIKQGWSPAGE